MLAPDPGPVTHPPNAPTIIAQDPTLCRLVRYELAIIAQFWHNREAALEPVPNWRTCVRGCVAKGNNHGNHICYYYNIISRNHTTPRHVASHRITSCLYGMAFLVGGVLAYLVCEQGAIRDKHHHITAGRNEATVAWCLSLQCPICGA